MKTNVFPTTTIGIPTTTIGKQLEIDVHRRKWNLVIHGIDGGAGEDEATTRQTCKDFAKHVLKVDDADATLFSVCHRLSPKPNAGIIIRFVDLAQRDQWLTGTKHLKNHPKKVSICPDPPPVPRPLKDELMQRRDPTPCSTEAEIPRPLHPSMAIHRAENPGTIFTETKDWP